MEIAFLSTNSAYNLRSSQIYSALLQICVSMYFLIKSVSVSSSILSVSFLVTLISLIETDVSKSPIKSQKHDQSFLMGWLCPLIQSSGYQR
jgi:hypothetical protein